MKILIYFTLLSLLFSSPSQRVFEVGKNLYELWDFEKSREIFLSLPQSSESFHNLGNTLYHLGNLSGALSYYSDSLALSEHELTKNNYEYVKSLLEKKEQNPQEQSWERKDTQQAEQNQDTGKGNQDGQTDQSEQEEQEASQSPDTSPSDADTLSNQRDEQYKLWEEKQVEQLSESEKQQLDNYIERLQTQEQQQRDSFGKLGESTQGDFGNSLFDQFFWESIFSNDFGKTEKDW